jgi:Ca2+-binding RTX toxin-like protein
VKADFSQVIEPLLVTTGPGSAAVNIVGGGANDTLTAGSGSATIDGGAGNDLITGGSQNDRLVGGSGFDTLSGLAGDDTLEIKRGASPDAVDGGIGVDLLMADFGKLKVPQVIDISNPAVTQTLTDGTTIVNMERLNLTAGLSNDKVVGGALADAINGFDGNDTLTGGGAGDTLNGGIGADVLIGGTGDDQLIGGAGADRFTPGVSGWGADRIADFEHGVDLMDLRGFGLSFAALTVSQSGTTTTISAGALGSMVLLNHTSAMTSGDFLFV